MKPVQLNGLNDWKNLFPGGTASIGGVRLGRVFAGGGHEDLQICFEFTKTTRDLRYSRLANKY